MFFSADRRKHTALLPQGEAGAQQPQSDTPDRESDLRVARHNIPYIWKMKRHMRGCKTSVCKTAQMTRNYARNDSAMAFIVVTMVIIRTESGQQD